jgi:hypothetical protein
MPGIFAKLDEFAQEDVVTPVWQPLQAKLTYSPCLSAPRVRVWERGNVPSEILIRESV